MNEKFDSDSDKKFDSEWYLNELLREMKFIIFSLDESSVGPAVNILPWNDLDRILRLVEQIEEFLGYD